MSQQPFVDDKSGVDRSFDWNSNNVEEKMAKATVYGSVDDFSKGAGVPNVQKPMELQTLELSQKEDQTGITKQAVGIRPELLKKNVKRMNQFERELMKIEEEKAGQIRA